MTGDVIVTREVHVYYAQQQFRLNMDELDLGEMSDEARVKSAIVPVIAAQLDRAEALVEDDLSTFVVSDVEGGNKVVKPFANYG